MTSFNISIQNMTCAGCAGRAERALNALVDTQPLWILPRIPRVWTHQLHPRVSAVAGRGYPAKIDKVIIQIADIQGAHDALERQSLTIHPSPPPV